MKPFRLSTAGGVFTILATLVGSAVVSSTAWAQSVDSRTLTLDDALALAEDRSQQIAIAQAAVDRADGGLQRVRSARKSQLNGAVSYDRTLDSEFRGLFDSAGTGPACDPLKTNALAPLADRVTELERAYGCEPASNSFGGGGTSDLPFGQDNAYRLNLQFSRAIYTGGRIDAQEREATLGKQTASIGLTTTRAQLAFDVSQAFYDAALSDQLVTIAEEVLAQAERAFAQTRAQRDAGRVSEFDLLRAQVSRDTLRPQVIQSRVNRDLAHLRVKQILDLPLTTPLTLVANLEDARVSPAQRLDTRLAQAEGAAGAPSNRTVLALAATDVAFRETAIDLVRAQRRPNVSLVSSYGRVGYRSYPSLPRQNWTLGAQVSMPLMTGGRIAAEEVSARADLNESRARQRLTEQLAVLDHESARLQVAAALAAWEATAGTIDQAQRAYDIAEIRYREGISTQLELSDARLLLQQAQVNRALAARNVQVARVRLALLSELPLTGAR